MSRQRRERACANALAARALLASMIGVSATVAMVQPAVTGGGASPVQVEHVADVRPLGPLLGRNADDGSGGDAGGGCPNGCGGGLSGAGRAGREASGSPPTMPVQDRQGRGGKAESGGTAPTDTVRPGGAAARDQAPGAGSAHPPAGPDASANGPNRGPDSPEANGHLPPTPEPAAPPAANKPAAPPAGTKPDPAGPPPAPAGGAAGAAGKVAAGVTATGSTLPPGVYLPDQKPPTDQPGYVVGGGPFGMGQTYLTHEQANNYGNILSLGGTALGIVSKPLGVIAGLAGGIFKVADSSSSHGGAVLTSTPIPFLPVIPWAR